MKNKILALLLISSALTACTDHFEKFNTEDGAYTEDKQGMDFAGNTMYPSHRTRHLFQRPSSGWYGLDLPDYTKSECGHVCGVFP